MIIGHCKVFLALALYQSFLITLDSFKTHYVCSPLLKSLWSTTMARLFNVQIDIYCTLNLNIIDI